MRIYFPEEEGTMNAKLVGKCRMAACSRFDGNVSAYDLPNLKGRHKA